MSYLWTFNFHKVVWQQNSGAVEDFILSYSAVYLRIQKWKNYWNRSTFAKVIVKIKVARFSITHGVVSGNIRYMWILAGFLLARPQMRVGLSTTAILSDLSGHFFGNFRFKASNIIWRYATPYRSVHDWLQNEWPRMTLSGYFMQNSVFVLAVLDSGGSTFKDNCVKSNKHRPILPAAKI